MPSATLLGQSLISGILVGGLYALLGLGLSLQWRFLKVIDLSHFALVFLSAYVSYQLIGVAQAHPLVVLATVVPGAFLFGVAMQAMFARFKLDEFATVLVTFGIAVIIEAMIQWFWTADFRKLETHLSTASWQVGSLFIPIAEALMFLVSMALGCATWAWLKYTYIGKALRASAENPDIAAAFGINHRRLARILYGSASVTGAIAGIFVALMSSLAPSQIFLFLGVVFSAVILGGLGNPIGLIIASLGIGIVEALTMAVTAPTWAPLVSFTVLILVLVLRPDKL